MEMNDCFPKPNPWLKYRPIKWANAGEIKMAAPMNRKQNRNTNWQENIDAKHQYAGKLICHALLSSL